MSTVALPALPQISERDLIAVHELLGDVRTQEEAAQWLAATITWLNAFTSFKRARRRYGLPHDAEATLYYGAVLTDLRQSGEALLSALAQNRFTLEHAPIDERNLRSCVKEMQDDERILASGLLHPDADFSAIEAVLGHV